MKSENTIKTDGRWYTVDDAATFHKLTNHIEVNGSDIFSELIKEAGRICEYYASDLLYAIEQFKRRSEESIVMFSADRLLGDTEKTRPLGITTWLAFRKSGVNFFTLKSDDDTQDRVDEWQHEPSYITRFILTMKFDDNGSATMELYRKD